MSATNIYNIESVSFFITEHEDFFVTKITTISSNNIEEKVCLFSDNLIIKSIDDKNIPTERLKK